MPKLTIRVGRTVSEQCFEGTPVLSSVLEAHGYSLTMPCGGRGVCGKCGVEAGGELSPPTGPERSLGRRLACQTRLLGDADVTLPAPSPLLNIAATGERPPFALSPLPGRYGLAVDIGTTTLAASLLSLATGEVLASAAMENPQRSVAGDVIGRIEASMAGGSEKLQRLVVSAVDRLRGELCERLGLPPDAPDQTVVTGNTTMLYLLTGRNPEPLSHAPFQADCLFGSRIELFGREAYAPPCIGAFIGADITCAILASRLCDHAGTAMLADVGTNGEIALWHQGRLYVCATAAGPAFEGGGIERGCGSVAGAVDRVWAQDGRVGCSTIGGASPVGLCGSGVIDAVATLLRLGWLDETGMLREERVPLTEDLCLTRKDVRNVQLAKGAIAAGMLTLCRTVGAEPDEVETLYLAGGFGKHLDLQNAAAIGLIPRQWTDRTRVIGNAALAGVEMFLLQTGFLSEAEACARSCEIVTLSGNPLFSELYLSCMMLEPTDGTDG